jgi:hypothetical protein
MKRTTASWALLGAAYLAVACAVTALWVHCARTEFQVDALEVKLPSGGPYSAKFSSIVRLAQGRAFSPFVKRRLLPDLARALAALPPDSWWEGPRRWLREGRSGPPWVRYLLERQEWKEEDVPILACAYLLIGASVLGFMCACRWLTTLVYQTPPWVADLAGAVLGVALLGGNGDWHYCGYPYDLPNAFVFALTLAAMLARRRWFVLAFAAAAYSKETSVLLIAAYLLLAPERRPARVWLTAGLLAAVYAAIRWWINRHYPTPEPQEGFWWVRRNLKYLGFLVFYSWLVPFVAVGLARMWGLRRRFPAPLVRLCGLAVPLVALAVFKGWIEELRQYLELLPVFGLLLFHWCLHEAGLGHLLRVRGAGDAPAPAARAA